MRHSRLLLSLLIGLHTLLASAQELTPPQLRSISLGYGGQYLHDSYLSPLNYGGYTLSLGGETLKRRYQGRGFVGFVLGRASGAVGQASWLSHRRLSLDYGSTDNPAGNASIHRLELRWQSARLYPLAQGAWGELALGPAYTLGGGALYSTRNGNNPLSLKLDLNLGLGMHYSYRLPWEAFPIRLRLATRTDLLGLQWGQHFGESYYELFLLSKAHAKRINLVHLGNQFAGELNLALDLPILRGTDLTLGYRLRHRSWSVNQLKTKLTDHSLTLGISYYITPAHRTATHSLYRPQL